MNSGVLTRALHPGMDPRIRERRVAVTRQLGRRRLRVLVVAGALCAAAAIALVVLHSGLFSAQHIEVQGSVHTGSATVIGVAGLSQHPPLIDLSPSEISARLERLPWIQSATVDVRWPDSVVVKIAERKPVATIATGSKVALIDGSGRVLAYVGQPPPSTVSLQVAGSTRPPGAPGASVPSSDAAALTVASSVPPLLEGRVRAVRTGARGSVSLDLGDGISASLGTLSQLPEKFEALASLLTGAQIKAPALIDLTVPDEPVVTPG